jgi:hypothetical protein
VKNVGPETVRKWSRELQAAWNRANCNAGKKCVRGVVDERKLLTENPSTQFSWVEGLDRSIRQFDQVELLGLRENLEGKSPWLTAAVAFAKVLLWALGRREEISSLQWPQLRTRA